MNVYYKNEWGELWHGDCLEIMDLLEIVGPVADMVLCDPPYGTTQNSWDSVVPLASMWSKVWACAKVNAPVVMTAATPFDKVLGVSCIERLKYEWIWRKNKSSGHLNAKKMPMRQHENVLVFCAGQPPYYPQMTDGHAPMNYAVRRTHTPNYGAQRPTTVSAAGSTVRYPKTVLDFPVVNNDDPERVHHTQKPVALFAYLIQTYTTPGEVVLDFCAGSGTTAVAAEMTGRRWVCIEKEEKYCELIAKRIDAAKN